MVTEVLPDLQLFCCLPKLTHELPIIITVLLSNINYLLYIINIKEKKTVEYSLYVWIKLRLVFQAFDNLQVLVLGTGNLDPRIFMNKYLFLQIYESKQKIIIYITHLCVVLRVVQITCDLLILPLISPSFFILHLVIKLNQGVLSSRKEQCH